MVTNNIRLAVLACCFGFVYVRGAPTGLSQTFRIESFESDPKWDEFRNRLPHPPRTTRQDFGWSRSRHAGGKRAGEIGGRVQRSLTPARCAFLLPRKLTLDEPLEASGTLSVTKDEGSSGVLVGWHHESSRGWRTNNSLAFRVDGNGDKYWLFFEYGTRNRMTGCRGVFEGERYQNTPTKPFAADGTVHRWRLAYDPIGTGTVRFEIDGHTYHLPVDKEAREDGAEFDRFGIWNQETTGGGIDVWIDDLTIGGEQMNFDDDPRWDAIGNRVQIAERRRRPFHSYGYSRTKFVNAGGEMGGIIWRDERPSYYACRTDPLTLDDKLFASGRISFVAAGPDSGVYIGWFQSTLKQNNATPEHEKRQPSYLGILLEGPSRVGHYFRPGYATQQRNGFNAEDGPIVQPTGSVHNWSIQYDPEGSGGRGRITVMLNGRSQSIDLHDGHRLEGATFDRFGIFNMQSGGWHVEVYLDDLKFQNRRR